ncbi:MAG: hypothetical protein KGI68_01645 [Alphaproteobacteria bacterium]|nr:hypothetical protein [Alphaproteobacteria bacterium]MDE1986645.1 hypothetical protein [Alphaproteobacteria bacterium]MDE2164418.1 hypothetical protein [Alphaproteobacteria bacterium]MDE2265285.1 hypothetical protein [Alphaproteobacteria bacterium]MDE2499080.1 hypothetical protein [Alphaproteobacteria bacterium]
MKRSAKLALGAMLLAGAAFAVTTPAAAGVSFGVGIGVGPGYYGPDNYGPPVNCNPYSRFYDPYYCGYYDDYDGPPLFIDGAWFYGGRYRDYDGHREYWMHDRWSRGDDGWHGDGDGWRGGGDWHGDRDGWRGGGDFHGGGGWHGGGHRR